MTTNRSTFSTKAPRQLFTVKQFAERYPAWSEQALRWLIFNAKDRMLAKEMQRGNGLECAILRQGRKVLIDEDMFLQWLENSNQASVQ